MITKYGIPGELHSDQGSNFESNVFKEMCKLLGIQKTRTSLYRSQLDGMVETIENMLSMFVEPHHKDWNKYIPLIMMAYSSSVHASTGLTPCSMMFKREITLPVDLCFERLPEEKGTDYISNHAYELEENLNNIHEYSKEN